MATDAIAEQQAHLREFSTVTLRRLPLYRYLAGRSADDAEVAARLLLAPPEQRWTTLLFAAVHDRVLDALDRAGGDPARAAAAEPLCAWYPSATPDGVRRPLGVAGDDPWPHFRRLALEDPAVAADLATRATQTNEVGRCATTVPALAVLAAEVAQPIGLVEVGASAGLNLRLDAYGYRYSPDRPSRSYGRHGPANEPGGAPDHPPRSDDDRGGPGAIAGPAAVGGPVERGDLALPAGPAGVGPSGELAVGGGAGLVLASRWRGPHPPPWPGVPRLPEVVFRVGIDRQPVDVTDDAAARWLVACQWPEQAERLDRCRRAVVLARADPPPLVAADLVAEVEAQVARVPAGAHPVVLSTWCLAYLDAGDQRRALAALDRAGAVRDLTLLYQEKPGDVAGLDPPPRPDGVVDHRPTALCRQDWRAGRRRPARRLADQHPHGTWAEWL